MEADNATKIQLVDEQTKKNVIEFLKYLENILDKITWNELSECVQLINKIHNQTGLTIENINTEHGLTEKAEIFKQMFLLYKKIHADLEFYLKVELIPVLDNALINYIDTNGNYNNTNKILIRNEFIITSRGNYKILNIIDYIYEQSNNYTFPNGFFIIKYFPAETVLPNVIMFKNAQLPITMLKYFMGETIDHSSLDLIITVDNDFVKQHVLQQNDINTLRNNIVEFLESILGEYYLITKIPRITVIPEYAVGTNELVKNNLKDIKQITNDIKKYLSEKDLQACAICNINNSNAKLKHFCNKLYCNYCYNILFKVGFFKIVD